VELRLEAIGILKRTIGFDRWCWNVDALTRRGQLGERVIQRSAYPVLDRGA